MRGSCCWQFPVREHGPGQPDTEIVEPGGGHSTNRSRRCVKRCVQDELGGYVGTPQAVAASGLSVLDGEVPRHGWSPSPVCDPLRQGGRGGPCIDAVRPELKRRLGSAASISARDGVARVLKKTSSSRGDRTMWCIPPQHNAAFVCRGWRTSWKCIPRPYDASYPVICMDESSKQCVVRRSGHRNGAMSSWPWRARYDAESTSATGWDSLLMYYAPFDDMAADRCGARTHASADLGGRGAAGCAVRSNRLSVRSQRITLLMRQS